MDRRVFITPGEVSIGTALTEEAEAAGWQVVSTVTEDVSAPENEEASNIIRRSGRSVLSARRTLLDCVNILHGIDVAMILHEAVQDKKPVHELSPVAIEEYVDTTIKDLVFILREVLSIFVSQGSGTLAMVSYVPDETTLLPLCAAVVSAFRGITDSLTTLYQNENIIINGFECVNESPERYSRFILQQLSGKAGETSGKWYRCGGAGRLTKRWPFRT